MPIYEYRCQACDREFERLVSASTVVTCPHCGASRVMRRLSLFGTRPGARPEAAAPATGGGCCGGGCGCR